MPTNPMLENLLREYPTGVALITDFGGDHPELMPTRRARRCIDNLASQPDQVKRMFRKRFGRWYVHIPSLVDYYEQEESLVNTAA